MSEWKVKFFRKIYFTLRMRIQLIKLMLLIVVFSSISILLTHVIIRIEESSLSSLEDDDETTTLLLDNSSSNRVAWWWSSLWSRGRRSRRRQYHYWINSCKPVIESLTQERTQQQYYVIIDGERYPKLVPTFFNRSIDFNCINANTRVKTILLWNWDDFSYGLGIREPFITNQCPAVNCELTDDKQKLASSDYVLVKYKRDLQFRDLPPQTANTQTRLTLYMSQPVADLSAARRFNRVFNLTATFHLNSHIAPLYFAKARFFWSSPNDDDDNDSSTAVRLQAHVRYFPLKRSVAALVDFDCHSKAARNYLRYLRRLNSSIPVSVYGRCGRPCSMLNRKACRERLYQAYKFVLIFEPHVRCDGYVSETFLDAFAYETIPVVFNRSAHEFFVPTSGFVRAYEFQSARSLGAYLRRLERDANSTERFFKWKRHIRFGANAFGSFCDMCIRAHLEASSSSSSSVVENLEDYLKCR